jgi:periplasmic protein CpxP/Spy
MTMETNETMKTNHKRHWNRHGFWALLVVPVLLAAGFFAARAQAQDGMGFGPGGLPGGSPEQHKAFMERHLDKMLDQVNATDSQRTAIKAIFERMFTEMQPIHQQHKSLHERLVNALTADTVDRAAVENLRKQIPTLADQASQVFTKALLDAGDVLNPAQRQSLAKLIQQHHGRHHHGM